MVQQNVNIGMRGWTPTSCQSMRQPQHKQTPRVFGRRGDSSRIAATSGDNATTATNSTTDASSRERGNSSSRRPPPPPRPPLRRPSSRPPSRQPRNGFFSDADPNATLYPVKGSLKQDPTTRSSNRYESDFVWNSNWKEAMEYNDSLIERQQQQQQKQEHDTMPQGTKGQLSLSQVKRDLNDMDVDLTEVLLGRGASTVDKETALPIPMVQVVNSSKSVSKKDATLERQTQRESRAWGRSKRYSSKPVASRARVSAEEEAALIEEEEDAQARYDDMKRQLYLWTLGLTAVCFGSTVVFYGRDVGASYGVGALGGFLYLRSLSRSMDSFGTGFGSAGSPRLLIPVILALGYNRYNSLISESSGLHLELLPMLVGFFTYKGAVVAKQGLELLDDVFDRNTSS